MLLFLERCSSCATIVVIDRNTHLYARFRAKHDFNHRLATSVHFISAEERGRFWPWEYIRHCCIHWCITHRHTRPLRVQYWTRSDTPATWLRLQSPVTNFVLHFLRLEAEPVRWHWYWPHDRERKGERKWRMCSRPGISQVVIRGRPASVPLESILEALPPRGTLF